MFLRNDWKLENGWQFFRTQLIWRWQRTIRERKISVWISLKQSLNSLLLSPRWTNMQILLSYNFFSIYNNHYLFQYTAIEDNKSLTINQANEETEALLDTIKTPYLKRFIYAVSYPDYAEGEEPLFTINAAKRRWTGNIRNFGINNNYNMHLFVWSEQNFQAIIMRRECETSLKLPIALADFPIKGTNYLSCDELINRWLIESNARSKEESGTELHRRGQNGNYRSKCIPGCGAIKERRMRQVNQILFRMSSFIFLSALFVSSLGISYAFPLHDISFNSPPFEKASADAKTEFSNIISVRLSFISREIIDCFQNESLTKGQLETEIKSWAAKNNATVWFLTNFSKKMQYFKDAVNAAQVKDQEFTRSLRGNITKAVNELPALITKVLYKPFLNLLEW